MAAMQREFPQRADLEAYLAVEFPMASGSLSPVRGGDTAARKALEAFPIALYAHTRNSLDGAVSRLSPYLRHGVLTLTSVLRHVGLRGAEKFAQELAWRDYFQRVYAEIGDGVWTDREDYKTGHPSASYGESIPQDVAEGRTGLVCMDSFVRELEETGYLHNHARMWFAAYLVHWRRIRWQAGARYFLQHLLDGDPASNNLSWQWVASTFSAKPYYFNAESLANFTSNAFCEGCPVRGKCTFEGSYEDLSAKLFPYV